MAIHKFPVNLKTTGAMSTALDLVPVMMKAKGLQKHSHTPIKLSMASKSALHEFSMLMARTWSLKTVAPFQISLWPL